jgi:hypothetical protein
MVGRDDADRVATKQEITMSGRTSSIAISAAIALGIVGAASVAQANDSGENSQGGFAVPGSMAGVNPVFHPGWIGKAGKAGNAYGYAATPIHQHRISYDRTEDR